MKKIIGITAAVLMFLMATGCSTDKNEDSQTTAVPTADTAATQAADVNEESVYSALLKDKLIPGYGLLKTEQKTTMTGSDKAWLEPKGIASAYVDDLDGNGIKDMLVFYFARDDDGGSHADMLVHYVLVAEAYTVENGAAQMTDKEVIHGYHDVVGMTAVGLYTNQHLHDDFFAGAVNVNGSKYVVCEYKTESTVFSDGIYEGYWALEYKGGQLDTAFSAVQAGPGSAGLEYTGYEFEGGKVTKSEILYSQEEDTGKYSDLASAVEGFFGEHGISCKYAHGEESIVTDDNNKTEIFEYSVEPSNEKSSPAVSVDLTFELDDSSNILKRD